MRDSPKILGILGGMGPITTARFLSSIYAQKRYTHEQEMPSVVVYSDPTFPDRTSSFLRGEVDTLKSRTTIAIERLRNAGVDKIVLCCFTLHHIVDLLPPTLIKDLVLLTDLLLNEIEKSRQSLLLCTNGSRELRIFEKRPIWQRIKDRVTFPSAPDQERIHKIIYRLKTHLDPTLARRDLAEICKKYTVHSIAFGCTDLHMLSNGRISDRLAINENEVIDPLMNIVAQLHSGVLFK